MDSSGGSSTGGTEGEGGASTHPSPRRDPSSFTLVEAAQYGVLRRCIELVEEQGASVTRGDDEDITVLHWAAINNRLDVASYFIQKGADVNAVGGELRGTPLHWATRQGHLPMVIVLMRYNANPYILDSEGLNCLHVAAQLGFLDITAYYAAKGMEMDVKDANSMTPIMHAASRCYSADVVRLLVSLDSSVTAVDTEGNTALHHAALGNNSVAAKVLVQAKAPVGVVNRLGKSPLVIAQEQRNRYIMQMLTVEEGRGNQRGVVSILLYNQHVSWWIMFLAPTLFFLAYGLLGVYSWAWYVYLIGLAGVTAVLQAVLRLYLPGNPSTPLPVGLVFATKFWLYYTVFTVAFPAGLVHRPVLFFLINAAMLYCYWRTVCADPGFIPKALSPQAARLTILQLCEQGLFDSSQFCSTCLVRKPVRSKHCLVCNRCVARFDHHCLWTYNCIGYRNHLVFLGYLLTLQWLLIWGIAISLKVMMLQCPPGDGESFWGRAGVYMRCDPWVSWVFFNCAVHFLWVHLLFASQCIQIFVQASTTNEKMNAFRYEHFRKLQGNSPFNRGLLQNTADFFGFSCCGNRPSQVDWSRCYTIPGEEDPLRERANQTIPLPYSHAQ